MGQHNLSQVQVLAHGSSGEQRQYAGQSVVSIIRFDSSGSKPVRQQSYVDTLSCAMQSFFDCKSHTSAEHSSVDVAFQGIAEKTVAASMSSEMAYNLVAEWAGPYKGVGSKDSCCHGACDELLKFATNEKANEEVQAKKAESEAIAARGQTRGNREGGTIGSAYSC